VRGYEIPLIFAQGLSLLAGKMKELIDELERVYDLLLENGEELEPEFARVLVDEFEELLDKGGD